MIDSINLHIATDLLSDNYFNQHQHLFTNHEKRINNLDITDSGNFMNFLIKESEQGLYLYGSLAKYYLGTNQKTLRQSDIQPAFNKLAEELNLPIYQAKVNRVDIAENIITHQPVNLYYPLLGNTRYFKRSEVEGNIYYKTQTNTISFYDKIRGLKKKRYEIITEVFNGRNVLRVENRFMKHRPLANYLGLTTVTVEDLVLCYPDLVNAWYKVFQTIHKRRNMIQFDPVVFGEKGLFDKQIQIMGVEAFGGLPVITDVIKEARRAGLFEYPNQPSNLLNKYTALMSTPKLTVPSPLIDELEHKMKIAYFVNVQHPHINYE